MPSQKPRLVAYVEPKLRERVQAAIQLINSGQIEWKANESQLVEKAVTYCVDFFEKNGQWPWRVYPITTDIVSMAADDAPVLPKKGRDKSRTRRGSSLSSGDSDGTALSA